MESGTKGEGGFGIVAPSYGPVHPSGKPYVLVSGGFSTVATITDEERTELHRVARMLNELHKPQRPYAPSPAHSFSAGPRCGPIQR